MLIKYRVLILAIISFTAVFVVGVALSIVSHKPKAKGGQPAPPPAVPEPAAAPAVADASAAGGALNILNTPFCGSGSFTGANNLLGFNQYQHLFRLFVTEQASVRKLTVQYRRGYLTNWGEVRTAEIPMSGETIEESELGRSDIKDLVKGIVLMTPDFQIDFKPEASVDGKITAATSNCSKDIFRVNFPDKQPGHA